MEVLNADGQIENNVVVSALLQVSLHSQRQILF